ncbi:MAG: winged helix DNA-binding domain-containing protein [Gemmatimonadaceae bacterium]
MFVTPADIRWMLALTAPRVKAAMASYDRKLELDDALLRRTNRAITRALRDGRHLTRTELARVLERVNIVAVTQRLAHIMMRAELDAVVCSGPRRGKQFTYALLDERVPPTPARDRDAALLELTIRYFATRGPATVHDFAWWSGLTVGDAKRGIEIAGSSLEREVIDDRPYWSDASAQLPRWKGPVVHLLPNYDEYFIGHKDRSAIGQRLRSSELVTGGDALIAYVVAVDGQLVGGWKKTAASDGVRVELALLTSLSSSERRALTRAVERYGEFLGVAVTGFVP